MSATRIENYKTQNEILKLLEELNKEHKVEFTTNQNKALGKLAEPKTKDASTQTEWFMERPRIKTLRHYPIIKLKPIEEDINISLPAINNRK